MAYTEQPVADPLHRLVALPLRGDGKRKRDRQIGEPTIRHEEVPKAEAMNRADEQVGRFAQAQPFEPARQLACAFLTVGDAGGATWCAHILGHDPRQLEHQRLGLAAAWARQDDTMAGQIVGRLLARIAGQVAPRGPDRQR